MAHRIINRNKKGEEKNGLSAAVAGIDAGNDSSASVKPEVLVAPLPEEELPEVVEEERKEVEVPDINTTPRKRGRKPKSTVEKSVRSNSPDYRSVRFNNEILNKYFSMKLKYQVQINQRSLSHSEFLGLLLDVFNKAKHVI